MIAGLLLAVGWTSGPGFLQAAPSPADKEAAEVLARLGIDRGICVLLDTAPAGLAAALAEQSRLSVYLQLPTEEGTEAARRQVDAAGLLGTRVYVERGPWSQIHLADDLADAVVVTPRALRSAGADRDELLRVVNPLGAVLLGDGAISKPYPAGADDWSHPYHGPDNNPLSRDRLIRAPYLTRFLSTPWFVPMPITTVASGGRLFKACGHIAVKRREWPWLNTLVALNGYNGTLLWKRPLEPGFMVHRNTMIATPKLLYLADSTSCKLIEAATGRLKKELIAPAEAAGPVWKWMAMEDGVLYALVGGKEFHDKTLSGTRARGGWPWRPMSKGFDAKEYPWGFGRSLIALQPQTGEVLWVHNEQDPIDSRVVCMKGNRIYYYAHPKFVACLDAKQGKPLWRRADAELLEAIGPHYPAQHYRWGFSSTSYMKCSDKAVYFAGPQRTRLVALSAADGHLLWQYPQGNFHLILRDDGLYAMGTTHPVEQSKKFDPLTGKLLADLPALRGNCTRVTATAESIFARGHHHGGTLQMTLPDHQPLRIALMRPPCHDGVLICDGLLHWGCWMCDCNLSLVGNICLGPAGNFDFHAQATNRQRLLSDPEAQKPVAPLDVAAGDWPVYRADNRRSAAGSVEIPTKVARAWQYQPPAQIDPAAPITAGGLVFVTGSDGMIRAIEAADGKLRWKAYTGGAIRFPPAVDDGRLLVGSNDGWVYAFEAATGRRLWRFRAAPAERMINLYGRLSSTWPVASGVLVERGVVYAAAGIANYDGTHVYALDAATGRIRWQNNTCGLLPLEGTGSGVSVQGHLLMYQNRLYLAGGNVVSPAEFDIKSGRCLNSLEGEWERKAPRGRELFVLNGKVAAFDQLLYSPEPYQQGNYFARYLLQADAGDVLIRGDGRRIVRIDPKTAAEKKPRGLWESRHFDSAVAVALGSNAAVVAGRLASPDKSTDGGFAVAALALDDGHPMWSHSLPAMPSPWRLATDAAGRIVVAMEDGRVLCLKAAK